MGAGLQRAVKAARATRVRYQIQRCCGAKNGRDLWFKIAETRDKEFADIACIAIGEHEPGWVLRVRKVTNWQYIRELAS